MTLTVKLKRSDSSKSPVPFSWDNLPSPSPPPEDPSSLPSPPTSWLSARDMKLFGAQPLTSTSEIGVVRCKECDKPILRSCMGSHVANCRAGGKKTKAGSVIEPDGSKKRKASPTTPDDPSLPAKKKAKPTTKVTKGRMKGPVHYDKQCGVINDKGLPCSRSLTCKSHSMGAKRAVPGRSRNYDELLLEWQRANNPNFVEPVRRESKSEKKEKREKEKLEKKRLADEAAAALGLPPPKKGSIPGVSKKVGKKAAAAAAAAAAVRLADVLGDDLDENLDELDSEVEVDELVRAVRSAREKGVIAQPLAVPCDAGSWFVQPRERARVCRDLLLGALGNGTGIPGGGLGGMASRNSSMNLGSGRMA